MLPDFYILLIWESETLFLSIPDYFRYPKCFHFFPFPVFDLAKAAAEWGLVLMIISFFFLITLKLLLFADS